MKKIKQNMKNFFTPDKNYFKSKRFKISISIILILTIISSLSVYIGYNKYKEKIENDLTISNEEIKIEKDKILKEIARVKEEKRLAEEEAKRIAEEKAKEEARIKAEEEEKKAQIEKQKQAALEYSKWHYNQNGLKIDITPVVKTNPNIKYWICDIEVSSPDRLKYGLSYGSYGGSRQTTSGITSSNGGILGFNASGFSFDTGKPSGMILQEGQIINGGKSNGNTLAINKDGIMFIPKSGTTAEELSQQGVRFTTQFGPVLISGGERLSIKDGKPSGNYPRTALGQVSPTKYVLVVADGKRPDYSIGLTPQQLQDIFIEKGCTFAYNLDGGGSTSLYFNGRLVNIPSDGAERPVADAFYFK